jgi:phospholipid/cholesterol/gamma-HCH transport system ATP-binding protein
MKKIALEAKNLYKSFSSRKAVINDVSFTLDQGSVVGLIGPSGSGKSVLLKILGGIIQQDSGVVLPELENRSVNLMFQEGALFDSLTVYDNLAFPLVDGKVPASVLPADQLTQVHAKVQAILSKVGLTRAAFKFPGQLSGGMKKRVSLARALVSKPKILLLDDPTAGLDPIASNVIMNLILEIHAEYNPTIIIVSHDLRRLLPRVNNIISLFDGQIRFNGNLEELQNYNCPELYNFVRARYDFKK